MAACMMCQHDLSSHTAKGCPEPGCTCKRGPVPRVSVDPYSRTNPEGAKD